MARLIILHWLFIANTMLFLFIALPFLAPVLEAFGLHLPAKIIFLVYRPTCHQLPERSFFVAGHQVAICARCSSIYVAFWAIGIIYAVWSTIRPHRVPAWKSPPLWLIGVAAIPMAIDGITQLFGFRVSTNLLRTVTGGLAGATASMVIFPYMHIGFRDARDVWESNQQQTPPQDRFQEAPDTGGTGARGFDG